MELRKYFQDNTSKIFRGHNNVEFVSLEKIPKSFFSYFGKSDFFLIRISSKGITYSYVGKVTSEKEYLFIKELWDRHYFKSTRFRIPKPISFIEKFNLLVMEKVEGDNLKSLILDEIYTFSNEEFSEKFMLGLEASIDWLVDFEIKFYKKNHCDYDTFFEQTRKEFNGLSVPKKFKRYLAKELTSSSLITDKIPIKLSNRNFRSRDIMINSEEVVRFDWNRWKDKENFIFLEASSFINELNSFFLYPLANKAKLQSIKLLFLELYFAKSIFKDYKFLFNTIHSYFQLWVVKRTLSEYLKERNFFRKRFLKSRIENYFGEKFYV